MAKFDTRKARFVSKRGWSPNMSSPSLLTRRVTLVIAFDFLLLNFRRWWEPMNVISSFYGRRLSGGNILRWCRLWNPACYNWKKRNFLSSQVVKEQKTSHWHPSCLFAPEPPGETFTNYFSLNHIPECIASSAFHRWKRLLDEPVINPTE